MAEDEKVRQHHQLSKRQETAQAGVGGHSVVTKQQQQENC